MNLLRFRLTLGRQLSPAFDSAVPVASVLAEVGSDRITVIQRRFDTVADRTGPTLESFRRGPG